MHSPVCRLGDGLMAQFLIMRPSRAEWIIPREKAVYGCFEDRPSLTIGHLTTYWESHLKKCLEWVNIVNVVDVMLSTSFGEV